MEGWRAWWGGGGGGEGSTTSTPASSACSTRINGQSGFSAARGLGYPIQKAGWLGIVADARETKGSRNTKTFEIIQKNV